MVVIPITGAGLGILLFMLPGFGKYLLAYMGIMTVIGLVFLGGWKDYIRSSKDWK